MRTWRNCHEECDRSKFVPEYSVRPNSISEFGWGSDAMFTFASGAAEGVPATGSRTSSADEGGLAAYSRINIDLSRSSSLYQNGLNEVRVRALFGLNLIRAF